MRMRLTGAVLSASVLAIGTSGCHGPDRAIPQNTAKITVDGATRTSHAVSCTQVEWLMTIDVTAAPARARAVLRLDAEQPVAEVVDIDNFNGFRGVANATAGKAEASYADGTFTTVGTAEGTDNGDVSKPRSAAFKIEVRC